MKMLVDVSHCSEQVGWDSMETSNAPVVITHSSSAAVCKHDRGKSDKLAKAIADNGGFFGVVIIPVFIQDETPNATLDHWALHVEHLVNVMGIDHVCVGTDKMGPGPGTDSLFEYPTEMPETKIGAFNWSGFREEHRVSPKYADWKIEGYNDFGDWPNLTIKLAERGFNEEEIRKLLGLNYLRVYKDVIG